MQVERYIFFPKCAERFGLVSPGLLLEGRDEDGEQGMLHSALQVLAEASAHLTCLKVWGRSDGSAGACCRRL